MKKLIIEIKMEDKTKSHKYKNLTKLQKLQIALNIRNERIKMNTLKQGKELFIKYNYYILILSFLILYLSIHTNQYLNTLSTFYMNNPSEYQNFLSKIYKSGLTISSILTIIYTYGIVSFMLYARSVKKSIEIDPLLVNLAYFTITYVTFSIKKHNEIAFHLLFMVVIPLIILLYMWEYLNAKTHIKKCSTIIIKISFMLIISFFSINIKYLLISNHLISRDVQDKQIYKIKDKIIDKKQHIIKSTTKHRSQ